MLAVLSHTQFSKNDGKAMGEASTLPSARVLTCSPSLVSAYNELREIANFNIDLRTDYVIAEFRCATNVLLTNSISYQSRYGLSISASTSLATGIMRSGAPSCECLTLRETVKYRVKRDGTFKNRFLIL